MSRILLVDDESSTMKALAGLLKAEGHDVAVAQGGEPARDLLRSEDFDLLITDLRMAGVTGLDLLEFVSQERPNLPTLMLTAYGTVETAVQALRFGVFDYITKPFKVNEFIQAVDAALTYNRTVPAAADTEDAANPSCRLGKIVAESESMLDLCSMAERVAPTNMVVLIDGEKGSGRKLVARTIHGLSPRKDKPFMVVDCSALPEEDLEASIFGFAPGNDASGGKPGAFEDAAEGTVLLDEIGAMPIAMQAKLATVIRDREWNPAGRRQTLPLAARLMAGTSSPLEDLKNSGRFREDLFLLLNVFPLNIKPLRERRSDILPLVHYVLRQSAAALDAPVPVLAPEAVSALQSYGWPGNVSELVRTVGQALHNARDGRIGLDALPPGMSSKARRTGAVALGSDGCRGKHLRRFLLEREQAHIRQALQEAGGNVKKAALALSISPAALQSKLQQR